MKYLLFSILLVGCTQEIKPPVLPTSKPKPVDKCAQIINSGGCVLASSADALTCCYKPNRQLEEKVNEETRKEGVKSDIDDASSPNAGTKQVQED